MILFCKSERVADEMAAADFLSRYVSGVHKTVNKMYLVLR